MGTSAMAAAQIDLIISLAADSDVAEKRVKLHVLEDGGEEELEECRRVIQSYIHMYADDHGFVSWRNTSRTVEGTYIVADRAREATDDKEWVRAVRIHLLHSNRNVRFASSGR